MYQRRIVLTALGVVGFAALLIIGYLMVSDYQQALRAAQIRSHDYAAILETRLDSTLRRASSHLQIIATAVPDAALDGAVVERFADAVNATLDANMNDFPELAGMRVLDRFGDQLYSSNRSQTPRANVADRDYFVALRDPSRTALVFSAVNLSRTTGRPTMVMAKALVNAQGDFRGIVIASVELNYFQEIFKSLDVGTQGTVGIYRLDNFARVVRWPALDDALNVVLPKDNPVRAVLEAGQRDATLQISSFSDGVHRVYSVHALQNFPFFITVGIASDDALQDWKNRAVVVSITALLLVALLIGLLVRLSQSLEKQAHAYGAQAESEERLRALFDRATEGIFIMSDQGRLIAVNAAFAQMHGYTVQEMLQMRLQDLDTPEALEHLPERMRRLLGGEVLNFEVGHFHKDGHVISLEVSSSLVVFQGERMVQSFFRDITKRKLTEELVRELAYYDPLTKLANRALLRDRLIHSLEVVKRSGGHGALMFLDLDNFKPVNDNHGHKAGDHLLEEVADRLRSCVRHIDTVARFGGDEFVVLLDDLPADPLQAQQQASLVAEKIRSVLSSPYQLTLVKGSESSCLTHCCSVSIGVALFLGSSVTEDDVLKWADGAMYEAKKMGRNAVCFHQETADKVAAHIAVGAANLS